MNPFSISQPDIGTITMSRFSAPSINRYAVLQDKSYLKIPLKKKIEAVIKAIFYAIAIVFTLGYWGKPEFVHTVRLFCNKSYDVIDLSQPDKPKLKTSALYNVNEIVKQIQIYIADYNKQKQEALEIVKKNGLDFQNITPPLHKDKDVALAAVKQNGYAYLMLAQSSLKYNIAIFTAALEQICIAHHPFPEYFALGWPAVVEYLHSINISKIIDPIFFYSRRSLKLEFELTTKIYHARALAAAALPLEEPKRTEVTLAAIHADPISFFTAYPKYRNDKKIALIAVKKFGGCLKHVSDRLKKDPQVVLAAVKQNGKALKYADPTLQADRKIVLAAIKNNGAAIKYAAEIFKSDEKLLLRAIRQKGNALKHAAPHLLEDQAFLLKAAKLGGYRNVLRWGNISLSNNLDFFSIAIRQDALALKYANPDFLKENKPLLLAAVKNYKEAYQYVPEPFQYDLEIVLEMAKGGVPYSPDLSGDDMMIGLLPKDMRNIVADYLVGPQVDPRLVKNSKDANDYIYDTDRVEALFYSLKVLLADDQNSVDKRIKDLVRMRYFYKWDGHNKYVESDHGLDSLIEKYMKDRTLLNDTQTQCYILRKDGFWIDEPLSAIHYIDSPYYF